MTNYDFWKNWSKKTEIEKRAIGIVKRARIIIVKSLPKHVLIAIYIKGSFVRREMKEGSDIDIVPIVTQNKYEKAIFDLNSKKLYPAIIVPLSLEEFRKNKLLTKSEQPTDLRALPDRFLKKLKNYKLVYGKALDPNEFYIRSDKESLRDEIKRFRKGVIPLYKRKVISFSTLAKEVFFLAEIEQNVKGKKVNHSFEGIVKSVTDKNHIVHDALKFRIGRYKTDSEKKAFIVKLNRYLLYLEKLI